MTVGRLQMYRVIEAEIELYKRKYAFPSLGVDTTKPSVQSGKISDPTANAAIQRMNINPHVKAEFKRLIDEKKELDDFIFGIKDELIKALIIRHFVEKESFADMSRALNYSTKHLRNVLSTFLKKIAPEVRTNVTKKDFFPIEHIKNV